MARRVHSCMPNDRIEAVEAVEAIMKAHQVRRVPVIDRDGHLVGLVSMNDIARESDNELKRKSPDVRTGDLVSTLASICQSRQPWTAPVASQ